MIIKINGKCSDMFSAILRDEKGKELGEYQGYVPKFMPGNHCGDNIILEIDLETGIICNWKTPAEEDLQSVFGDYKTEQILKKNW